MIKETKDLPEEFDWRDKDGVDFVSPVRNQGQCGSCYAFASMGQLESGVRIKTNGRIQVVFSPQDVVSCSEYSQGCDGGKFVQEALPNHFLARISNFFIKSGFHSTPMAFDLRTFFQKNFFKKVF